MRKLEILIIIMSLGFNYNLQAQYTNTGYIWSAPQTGGGGTLIQGVAEEYNAYTRSIFSNNVYWDFDAHLWRGNQQGANDISAIMIPNGGGFQFIFHESKGNYKRDFEHWEFISGHLLSIDRWGCIRFLSGDGRGIRFWDSNDYSIYMSEIGHQTFGGQVNGESSSDYNMYFRMANGTNRGFVFKNGSDSYFSINPQRITSEVPFRRFKTSSEYCDMDFYGLAGYRGTVYVRNNMTNGLLAFDTKGSDGTLAHRMIILGNGNIGIGEVNPSKKLVVNGVIGATEVKVSTTPNSDYVFEPDYNLLSLKEVESFIQQNKHLPDIPSAEEFKENGVGLGEMDDMLLRKVEELTLYVIELKKENEELKATNQRISKLEALVDELMNKAN